MNQDDILRRIRALMAKTTDNGATEEEALAAARKVGELVDKYELDLSSISLREEVCIRKGVEVGRTNAHPVQYTAVAISKYTDTKAWIGLPNRTIHFFGLKPDVEVAIYLTHLFRTALEREWRGFGASLTHTRRHRTSFMRGMAGRLSERLEQMKADREKAKATGTSLVVAKGHLVSEQFAKSGVKLGNPKPRTRRVFASSYKAGQAAGDRVAINPGVHGSSSAGVAALN